MANEASPAFETAKSQILAVVQNSRNVEDLDHAINTAEWVVKLRENAGEVLQLAGFGHDIQRGTPDRLVKSSYSNLEEYAVAHAERSAVIASQIAAKAGYPRPSIEVLKYLISNCQFHSSDPDVQLLRDANSISVFDSNVAHYLKHKGKEWTKSKMQSNFLFSSDLAKNHIKEILIQKSQEFLLFSS